MRSLTCVSVVVCVARKLRPCPSYSRRRDRINLGLWRSLYKGGGGSFFTTTVTSRFLDYMCNRLILGCFGGAVPTALPCTRVTCRHRSRFSARDTQFIV